MICPQTSVGCYNSPQCKSADSCVIRICNPPPTPTMAEIERLVDAFGNASLALFGPAPRVATIDRAEARAALLAAIRKYGER